MIGPPGLDDGSRLSPVSSQGYGETRGSDTEGHAARKLGQEYDVWAPRYSTSAHGVGRDLQHFSRGEVDNAHWPSADGGPRGYPPAEHYANNHSTASEEESEDFGNFCQRVAASIGLPTPSPDGADISSTPLATAAAAYDNPSPDDVLQHGGHWKESKGKSAAGDSVEVRVILTDEITWASTPPPAASASDAGASRPPSDVSGSADSFPRDYDARPGAQVEPAVRGYLHVDGHEHRESPSEPFGAAPRPAWESQGWAQAPPPADIGAHLQRSASRGSAGSASDHQHEGHMIDQGWALQSLAREERHLENELYSLNHEIRNKMSAGQAQQLAQQAMEDISSALSRGSNATGGGESGHYNPLLDTSAGQHSQLSSGPSEYVPGQVSDDMYVPSGGSRRAGSTRPSSPSPSRQELWAAPEQFTPPLSPRSLGPAAAHHQGGTEQMVADALLQSRSGASSPYSWQEGAPRADRGREELDTRVADRLYGSAVDQRQRQEQRRRSAREERQEAAMEGCTFRPAICPKSTELGRSAVRQMRQGQPKPNTKKQHGRPQVPQAPAGYGAFSYSQLFDDAGPPAAKTATGQQQRAARPASAPRQRQSTAASIEEFLQGSRAVPSGLRSLEQDQRFQVRGFDHTAPGDDYEVTLAASVARARRSPSPHRPVDVISPANSHLSAGDFSELADLGREVALRPKPDDAVVTNACLRLYEKGLESQVKLEQKRRLAHKEEQKMSQAAFRFIQSRSRSPGPRVPPGGGREMPLRQRDPSPAHPRPAAGSRAPSAQAPRRTQSPEVQRSSSRPRDEREFQEFLARQSEFLKKKEKKVTAAISADLAPKPSQVSSGSRRILAKQEDAARRLGEELFSVGYPMHRAGLGIASDEGAEGLSRSPRGALPASQTRTAPVDFMADTVVSSQKSMSPRLTTASMSFMQRLEMAMSGGQGPSPSGLAQMANGSQRLGVGIGDLLPKECTFKPQITQRGANRKPRSPAEMSEGDRRRKEALQQEMTRERQRQEMEGVTFSPQLLSRNVPGRLCVNNPDAYMEFLDQRRQNKEIKAAQQRARQAEDEVSGCTFAPRISRSPPRHVERMAKSHAARVAAGLARANAGASPERQWR